MRFACRENLRIILGVLLVFTVTVKPTSQSQDTGGNVSTGFIGGSVVLQCACPGRNLEEYLRWQKDGILILKHSRTDEINNYGNRVKLFVAENTSNCSLQINRLTKDDQGMYQCYFSTSVGDVKDFGYFEMSLIVSDILPSSGRTPGEDDRDYRWFCVAIIPIVLVLGLSLAKFHRWKVSRREALTRGARMEAGLLEGTEMNSKVSK